jgi:tRNA modification GTPase
LNHSTVVALATSPGPGAISVIRMSGEASLAICDEVFRGRILPSRAADRSAILGEVVGADGSPIDQVIMLVMRAPRSFTGEDMAEISCHGGHLAPKLVLRRLVEAGAEVAGPGEFTKRAFLNGKMDLVQAEAVVDIVQADSEKALKAAVRQLGGDLSKRFASLECDLFETLTRVEANIDFHDEEDIGLLSREELTDRLDTAIAKMEEVLTAHEQGRHIKQGFDVVIVGRPNVGKSSLFNRLLGEDRAITSSEPGTTRDIVDGLVSLNGFMLRLHDTAGLGAGVLGEIEREAAGRARRQLGGADLALIVVDASRPLSGEDMEVLSEVARGPHLIIANKTDLPEQACLDGLGKAVRVSALKGWGMAGLLESLRGFAHERIGDLDCEVLVSERHAACVRKALAGLRQAREAVGEGLSIEFPATDMKHALDCIGEVTGRKIARDVLDEIFSRFCIGK